MHLVSGYLADRAPLNFLLVVSRAFMAVAMGLLGHLRGAGGIIPAGMAMGIAQALLAAVGSKIWPMYYGRQHLGRIRGAMVTVMVASSSVGPFLVGLTRDLTGGYGPVLVAFTLLPIPMCILAFLATLSIAPGGIGGPSLCTASTTSACSPRIDRVTPHFSPLC